MCADLKLKKKKLITSKREFNIIAVLFIIITHNSTIYSTITSVAKIINTYYYIIE